MLVHEDLPPSKFYLNPKFSAKPWNRLNPLDYAANSKITETKKAPLFEKCFFVTATGFKPVTGWSVVSYSIQLSYAAIVSWLRVQRYVFVLNMQTFRLLFCEFNLTFLDWRSGNQCLSQSWNSPSDNCIRWRTDWYIRMAIAIRPPLHPYN